MTTKEILQEWLEDNKPKPSGTPETRFFNWENMIAFAEHYHIEQLALFSAANSVFCENCKHTIDVRLKRNPCKCVECGGVILTKD